MVHETGSIPSLHLASFRDAVPFSTGISSRKRAVVENIQQASAGQLDRPGFSASVAKIRASAEQRAIAATQLRQFQTNIQRADELLGTIKAQLVRIVKQYPPFAHDDPQRLAYLNAIAGLRKQLEALTFPPASEPGKEPDEGVGQQVPRLSNRPVKADLAIPELDPVRAGDEDVASALDAVTHAQARARELRESLWQDVVRYVGTANLGPGADGQVEAQARQVRAHVASNTSQGMGLSLNSILSMGI